MNGLDILEAHIAFTRANGKCVEEVHKMAIGVSEHASTLITFHGKLMEDEMAAMPILNPKLVKRLVTKLTPYIEQLQILDFSMDVPRNAGNIKTAVDAWLKLGCEFAKPHYAALFLQLQRFAPSLYLGTYRALLASAMATHPAIVHASLSGTQDLPQPELTAWGAEPSNAEHMKNLIATSIMTRFDVLSGGPSGSRTPTDQPIADALSAFDHESDEEVVAPQAAAPEIQPANEADIERAARKAARRACRAAEAEQAENDIEEEPRRAKRSKRD